MRSFNGLKQQHCGVCRRREVAALASANNSASVKSYGVFVYHVYNTDGMFPAQLDFCNYCLCIDQWLRILFN